MLKPNPVTILLYLFVLISQVAAGMYVASAREAPPVFSFIYGIDLIWILGWWLREDATKRGVSWIYDMGFFLNLAWPFIMPYHLLKTRGIKGLVVILAFLVVYVLAILLGGFLYLVLAPAGWPSAV